MRIWPSLVVALLALFSRVSAERVVRVIATIPNESLLPRSDNQSVIQPRLSNADEDTRPFKDVEVTGFITKNGDLFEMAEPRGLGSIEPREEPEPGMSMCRYGSIVVYSDTDCNTFIKSSQNLANPVKTVNKGDESEIDEADEKPVKKKKKKTRRNKGKPNRNKVKKRKRNNKRKNPVRRKGLKQGGNKNRRRNGSNQKRRRKYSPNKRRNQRRGNKKNGKKRRRVNNRD